MFIYTNNKQDIEKLRSWGHQLIMTLENGTHVFSNKPTTETPSTFSLKDLENVYVVDDLLF